MNFCVSVQLSLVPARLILARTVLLSCRASANSIARISIYHQKVPVNTKMTFFSTPFAVYKPSRFRVKDGDLCDLKSKIGSGVYAPEARIVGHAVYGEHIGRQPCIDVILFGKRDYVVEA